MRWKGKWTPVSKVKFPELPLSTPEYQEILVAERHNDFAFSTEEINRLACYRIAFDLAIWTDYPIIQTTPDELHHLMKGYIPAW